MKKAVRAVLLGLIVVLALTGVVFAGKPEGKDYISYWSAGKLLAQHADPYSADAVFTLEKAHGYNGPRPLVMRNLPWSLFLALPLGYVSLLTGLVVWLLAGVACLVVCLEELHFSPKDRILAYCFAPLLACLITGQSSPFLLLGVATFLAFQRTRPWLAGGALLLMASKPHVFFAFWPLLLFDCIYKRRFRLLGAGALAIAAASAIALLFDPHVFADYGAMFRSARIDTEIIPSPAFMLRKLISVNTPWLQLIPSAIVLAWAAWYYARNRRVWDWSVHFTPLLFACVFASPYVWMTDEVVLLPCILLTLAYASETKHAAAILMVLSGVPIVMLMAQISLPTGAYAWTSTAWFVWYLWSRGWRVLVAPTDRFHEAGTLAA